jgi:branched-chain amino acid transport system permease protein
MPHEVAFYLQQLLNIVQLASFYVPLALSFAILQAVTRRIYLSFGDLAMFASFAAVYACFDALLQGHGDLGSVLIALAAAILCGAALGYALARLMLGPRLLREPLAYMIASIGVGIALQETMRLQSGSRDIWVPPPLAGEALFRIEGSFPLSLSMMTALAIFVALSGTFIVVAILGFSRFGLYWRACAQSLKLAALSGIDADHVARMSFALAGGLAGVTGWTAAISYGGANFSIGLLAGFKAMFASVIGGFGSLRGAIAGAIALALIEVSWSVFFSTGYRDVAVFAIIILVLTIRPEGLLGSARRRESEET